MSGTATAAPPPSGPRGGSRPGRQAGGLDLSTGFCPHLSTDSCG